MRRSERVKFQLQTRSRPPDKVVTMYISCSRGKRGVHPVTIASATHAGHSTLLGVKSACDHLNTKERDVLRRLGGTLCCDVKEATRKLYGLGKESKRGEYLDVDMYAFKAGRGAALEARRKTTPFRFEKEDPDKKWERLFTEAARKAAGPGYESLRVKRHVQHEGAPKIPEVDHGMLTLYYGHTMVAERRFGRWKFNDLTLESMLATTDGNSPAGPNGYCEVCKKYFRFFEPHLRKGRHVRKLIEGFKRAMFRLRARKTTKPYVVG